MEPINDSGKANSVKGQGGRDTNINDVAIKQSLEETQAWEDGCKKQVKKEVICPTIILYAVGVATKSLNRSTSNQNTITHSNQKFKKWQQRSYMQKRNNTN